MCQNEYLWSKIHLNIYIGFFANIEPLMYSLVSVNVFYTDVTEETLHVKFNIPDERDLEQMVVDEWKADSSQPLEEQVTVAV